VKLFAEYAAEIACLDGPRWFEHDHHRFTFCVGRKPIDYVPHWPAGAGAFEVVLMSGLPGSDMRTVARAIAAKDDRPVIRLDDLRDRMGVDGADDRPAVACAVRE
jgi:hypothetical protein